MKKKFESSKPVRIIYIKFNNIRWSNTVPIWFIFQYRKIWWNISQKAQPKVEKFKITVAYLNAVSIWNQASVPLRITSPTNWDCLLYSLKWLQIKIKASWRVTCSIFESWGSLLIVWTAVLIWSNNGNNKSGYRCPIFTKRAPACRLTFFTALERFSFVWPGREKTEAAKIFSKTLTKKKGKKFRSIKAFCV